MDGKIFVTFYSWLFYGLLWIDFKLKEVGNNQNHIFVIFTAQLLVQKSQNSSTSFDSSARKTNAKVLLALLCFRDVAAYKHME